jgi:hypothetical protein
VRGFCERAVAAEEAALQNMLTDLPGVVDGRVRWRVAWISRVVREEEFVGLVSRPNRNTGEWRLRTIVRWKAN